MGEGGTKEEKIWKRDRYITDLLQPVLTLSSRSTVLHSATRSDFLVGCVKMQDMKMQDMKMKD